MSETPESLLGLINTSGFLFQIRVENEIKRTSIQGEHPWHFVGSEHRWQNNQSSREGFIDIVIQNTYSERIAIECKRTSGDATWVFLVPNESGGQQNFERIRALWAWRREAHTYIDWGELFYRPPSFESAFCVVRGQNDRLMIERIADTLLPAVENLAYQELQLNTVTPSDYPFIYIPLIVTNAELQVCHFDPTNIDLKSGALELPEANFQPVPYLRFKKALTTNIEPLNAPNTLERLNTQSQRVMFIVNVEHIINFLRNLTRSSGVASPPWRSIP